MSEEMLIEAVRGYPCLWQVRTMSYRDVRAKDNAWTLVSTLMEGLAVEECKRRWKSLRDKFVREVKKTKTRRTGDPGPPYVSQWPLFATLGFLEETVQHRRTTANLDDSELIMDFSGGGADELVEEQEREPEAVEVEEDRDQPRAEVQGSKGKSKKRKSDGGDVVEKAFVDTLNYLRLIKRENKEE
ncbi:uncharacterized protein [Oscarella lobularis]|uniref:uncharacterized protein n=1 Tax=Oscarella lobularis TaxID=121494 RepID=UPI00331335A0